MPARLIIALTAALLLAAPQVGNASPLDPTACSDGCEDGDSTLDVDDESEAGPVHEFRKKVEEGTSLFQDGLFADARDSFQNAYELFPEPVLLFNIASTYRREEKRTLAISAYQRFLREAKVDDVERRALAERALEELLASEEEKSESSVLSGTEKAPVMRLSSSPATTVRTELPWYRDRVGAAFTLAGALSAVGGAALMLSARSNALAAASDSSDHGLFAREVEAAQRRRLIGGSAIALGGLSALIGAYRLVRATPEHSQLHISSTGRNLSLSLSARF